VGELEKKLKSSKYKNAEYVKVIEGLKKRIEEQNQQIESLQKELAEKNIMIQGLNEDVKSLSANVDTLKSLSSEQKKKIENQTQSLNTVYYVVGTSKELKEHGVVDRSGGFIGMGKTSKLSTSINTDYFTKIDLTKVTKIPVQSDKAVVISSHPDGSYSFEGSKPIQNLVVSDPQKFWSLSKYLVIETK
jgi:seryl-tRNA synthetase